MSKKFFDPMIISEKFLKEISGGAAVHDLTPPPLPPIDPFPPLSVVGQFGGNDLDSLNGGVRVTANYPITDDVYVSPAISIDTNGQVVGGGGKVNWRLPF